MTKITLYRDYKLQNVTEAYTHWCNGCSMEHLIAIQRTDNGPTWTFNRDFNNPTFSPSVRISLGKDKNGTDRVCHYFLQNSNISYCGDSTHHLANQIVPLPPFPDDWLDDYEIQNAVSLTKE